MFKGYLQKPYHRFSALFAILGAVWSVSTLFAILSAFLEVFLYCKVNLFKFDHDYGTILGV